MAIDPADELPHAGLVDEWVFAAWAPDGSAGLVSGHRLFGRRSWYWFGLVQAGHPLLQITEWDVRVRADPFIVKAPEMWAEHHCVAPLEQWTVGNEAHAAALDDPAEALGRGYGVVTPMASDVEWYATGAAVAIDGGYVQDGVAHGLIELLDRSHIEWAEVPGRRWHRWSDGLGPLELPTVRAHTGLRAPFAFPDGTVADWVLTPEGWRSRV
ncbi:MAG TPA: hypothetical protein VNQ73_23455 [Ilumatobacter sp.]|nr:hypothetical protein [Ilumatobacter sp.]